MFRILFSTVILLSLVTFVQSQKKEEAYKFFEYEKVSDKLLKEKLQSFCDEADKTSWIGWIINYGTSKEVTRRENQLSKNLRCSEEFPSPRITFINGEDEHKSKTVLWIVPPGAKPPTL